ncbi:MAG: cupin domain-containing protein [Myxococcaceae bacterium]|nr:cupin domain-containing protein [Myxococcaceae bacterium]
MSEHVVDELYGYTAGHLDPQEVSRVEQHLRSCPDCRREADELDALQDELASPPKSALQALVKELAGPARFAHLAARVAKVFDITEAEANEQLTRIDDPKTWDTELWPGVWVAPVNAGPKAVEEGAFTVFLKVEPGAVFPNHVHGGEEQVLVLEGGYVDVSGTEYWRGELDVRPKGTSHSFTGLPGLGCICAARTFPVTGGE